MLLSVIFNLDIMGSSIRAINSGGEIDTEARLALIEMVPKMYLIEVVFEVVSKFFKKRPVFLLACYLICPSGWLR